MRIGVMAAQQTLTLLVEERYVRDVEVAGSNPVTPIKMNLKANCFEIFLAMASGESCRWQVL